MSSSNDSNNVNNLWFHPVLLSLMEGRTVQDELAFQYIQDNMATIAGQIKTLSENNLDLLAIQIAEWCLKVPTLQMDVNVVSNFLFVLNKLGRSEDFHRQCCQLPCCLAKEVMKVMEQSSFQIPVLRIASEIFLLQDLLNPSVSCCTKDLLNFWLSTQKEENLTNELIVENINKMLGIVEEFNTLCTFVEVIFNVFSARFLPLCTDLSLRIFQAQKLLICSPSYLGTPSCIRLVQTIEIIGKLFRNFTPLYSECLLTSLSLDPSLPRYTLTLNFFLGRTSGVPVSACKMLPVDIKVYNSVLQTVGQLRPVQLDRQMSWSHLRQTIITYLASNGYSLDASGTIFIRTLNSVSDERELDCKLMIIEEQEANLNPTTSVSSTSKFGLIQPPKPRSNTRPGARRQNTIGRGQKRQLTQMVSIGNNNCAVPVVTNNNQISYQNYQFQSSDSTVNVLPQVSMGASEMMPIIVDQDPSHSPQNFGSNQSSNDFKASNYVENESGKSSEQVGSSLKASNQRPKVARVPSRTSPRRLQSQSSVESNHRGVKYEDENISTPSTSRRLRTRHSESLSISESSEVKFSDNKAEECEKVNSPRRGRPPKSVKANGSCEKSGISKIANPETLILNGLKNFKRLKNCSTYKGSFFNIKKYKKQQRHLWIKSRKKPITSPDHKKGIRLPKKDTISVTSNLPNCFVSLPKLSSSEVIGRRILRRRKVDDLEVESEVPPKKMNKKSSEKQNLKLQNTPETNSNPAISESAVNPCVCDGCGEVVPDCNWLTAHIVVCPGMTGGGGEEEGENMMVSSEETWNVDQSKMEHQQQTSKEGDGFVQRTSFVEYPANPVDDQVADSYQAFENHSTYVVNPRNPIIFGKEISVDGMSAFSFSLHRCSHCCMVFYTNESLVAHLKSSDHFYASGTEYEVLVCSKCGLHFLEKTTLWFHSQYSCGRLGSVQTVEHETYKCWICHKDFLSELFLARHLLGKHATDNLAFHCLHQQLVQHKKQQMQYQGQYQVAKNPTNYSSLVTNGNQSAQSVTANQSQLTTIDTTQIASDFFQQATCDLYQSSANLLYSQSDSYPQTGGAQRIIAQSNGYFQQTQQQSEFSTVSVLPISMSESQDVYYGVQSQPTIMNSNQNIVQTQGETFTSASGTGESAGVVAISTTPGSLGSGNGSRAMRRAAKGIMYKNVYMQCVVNYHCSHCKTDLSTKALKKEHRISACFDANSNRFSYLRQYSYLCPYCGEKFPSQKVCRQHQLSVCLVLMGVKTDELNFKQHNCPFCNKKYFNVITLKGHLTLAHKDRVDSTDCGAQDADDGGNEDLIGGVGGKYSNLIVNNPLVPIPNLEAGPVFSSLATSPLKVALQQQLQQPHLLSMMDNTIMVSDDPGFLPITQVLEPSAPLEPNGVPIPASVSSVTALSLKSRSKKKYRGKSLVIPQTSGLTSTRSLRNNPRSSRYHYDDDFCSGEDLDVFEPKLSRSISEKSDRQTRSSCRVDDGKSAKSDFKNGDGETTKGRNLAEDDADSDATDDLTVDESAIDEVHCKPEVLQNMASDDNQVSRNTPGQFTEIPAVDLVLKARMDPFVEQISEANEGPIFASTYVSLQPLNQVGMDAERNVVPRVEEKVEGSTVSPTNSSRSSSNKFIIDNLLGHSSQDTKNRRPRECGSDSDCQDDFLINIDSSLDTPGDDDSQASSNSSSIKIIKSIETHSSERVIKSERPRILKQELANLFSATYARTSRQDLKVREDSNSMTNLTQSDNSFVAHRSEDYSNLNKTLEDAEVEKEEDKMGSGLVTDVKKRTILKKLSSSLNMASKRQPSAIGGAKFK